MSKFLYGKSVIASNISSTTHTANIGTLTDNTDIERIYDRSIKKSYNFTKSSAFAVCTLTINTTSTFGAEGIALLGVHPDTQINSVEFYFGGLLGSETTLITTRTRKIDGVEYKDFIYSLDSDLSGSANKIIIEWEGNNVDDGYFSAIYVAEKLIDINVDPKSIKYDFKSQGVKERTEGGQIIASENNSYMTAKFKTTATNESNIISNYFDINYVSSVSDPIVFIPQPTENIVLYGTQEKTNSTAPPSMIGRDSATNEWLYETTFSLEEEL